MYVSKQNYNDAIEGIRCDVNNCYYNKKDTHSCTAPEVKVGPQYAACSGDTICATFQPE